MTAEGNNIQQVSHIKRAAFVLSLHLKVFYLHLSVFLAYVFLLHTRLHLTDVALVCNANRISVFAQWQSRRENYRLCRWEKQMDKKISNQILWLTFQELGNVFFLDDYYGVNACLDNSGGNM